MQYLFQGITYSIGIFESTSDKKNNNNIYVQSGYLGSVHDSRVFTSTDLHKTLETDPLKVLPLSKFHIIEDSAFALGENLMIPYRDTGNLTAKK